MKITYIHQHFKRPSEGGGTRSWEFARRAAAQGHEVTLIGGGPAKRESHEGGFRIIQVPAPYDNRMSKGKRVVSFLRFMGGATVAAVRTPADVIYATSTPLTVAIPAMVAAKVRRRPWVFEVRDLWPSVPARLGVIKPGLLLRSAQVLEATAYRSAMSVVALSPGMRDGVLQTHPGAEVTVIPNACDFDMFGFSDDEVRDFKNDLGWDDGIPTVVYAGSFGPTYRIPWLVQLAAATNGRARWQIIGEGAATKEAQELALRNGLSVEDLLPGNLPKPEVAKRLAAATAAISSLQNDPALHVNSLNKVFDAMAAAKPVFFNHDGWLSDLLQLHGAGVRLSPDLAIAAEQLIAKVSDNRWTQSAGTASRELGKEQFDRDSLYESFISVIRAATVKG